MTPPRRPLSWFLARIGKSVYRDGKEIDKFLGVAEAKVICFIYQDAGYRYYDKKRSGGRKKR